RERQAEQPHRAALLGQQPAIVASVPGQALEALVAGLGKTENDLLQTADLDARDPGRQVEGRQGPGALVDDGNAAITEYLDRLGIGEADQLDLTQHVALDGY